MWEWQHDPKNPNATPQYDSWGWWGAYWSCTDWVTWHQAMIPALGKPEADSRMENAWSERGIFGHELNCILFDTAFIDYFKSQGFDTDSVTGAIQTIGSVIDNTGDAISNATDVLKWAIPVAVIALLIFGIIYLQKQTA